MKIKCPKCSYEYDFREACRDGDLLEIIRMQADFGGHSRLFFEYAELFGTTRPIKAAKLRRILSEVREVWVSGKFSFQKRTYLISQAGFVAALKTVCNKHFATPLEGHGYLCKVAIGQAEEEERQRSQEAERALRKKEDLLQAGVRPDTAVERREIPTAVKTELEKIFSRG